MVSTRGGSGGGWLVTSGVTVTANDDVTMTAGEVAGGGIVG